MDPLGQAASRTLIGPVPQYRGESDPLTEFISERCEVRPGLTVGGKMLFDAYRGWCTERDIRDGERLNQTAFGLRIKERFPNIGKRTVEYSGLAVRSQGTGSDSPLRDPSGFQPDVQGL